jgi:hypothetical protein
MDDEAKRQEQELITITGGVQMEVTYQSNGNGEVKKENVKVRQIPISRIQDFIFAMGNEAALIEVYCDRPKGWADTLTMESASAIADKGQELNVPFFAAWFRRQLKWRATQEEQAPGSTTIAGSGASALAPSTLPSVNSPLPSPISTG